MSQKQLFQFIHPDDLEMVKQAVDEVLGSKRPLGIDFRIVLKGGQVRFLHAEAEVRCDKHDHPMRMVGTMQNITARKQREFKVQESEQICRAKAVLSPL